MSINTYDSVHGTLNKLSGTTDENRFSSRNLLKDTVGWTGKNLLKRPYHDTTHVGALPGMTVTRNGLTYTVNEDGSVTVNGTATAGTYFIFNRKQDWEDFGFYGERVKLKVSPVQDTVYMQLYNTDQSRGVAITDATSGEIEFVFPSELSQNTSWNVSIDFAAGAVVDNVTFYPMLVRAGETDGTYEEYRPNVDKHLEDQKILGSKNLLECNMRTKTLSGFTATRVEETNGAVTYVMSGADTGSTGAQFQLCNEDALLAFMKKHVGEKFILTGCPEGGDSTNGYFLGMYFNFDGTTVSFLDTGNGVEVTIPNPVTKARIGLTLRHNATFDNTVFRPMLRLASDLDDTFVPHAQTNIELTERTEYREYPATEFEDLTKTFARKFGHAVTLEFENEDVSAIKLAYLPTELRPSRAMSICANYRKANVYYHGIVTIHTDGHFELFYCPTYGGDRVTATDDLQILSAFTYIAK